MEKTTQDPLKIPTKSLDNPRLVNNHLLNTNPLFCRCVITHERLGNNISSRFAD